MCASRRRDGRARRTGHDCASATSLPPTIATRSVDGVRRPRSRSTRRARRRPGGTSTRCSNAGPSSTTPSTWPASTVLARRDLGPERPRRGRRRTSSRPGAGTSRRARSAGAARRRRRRAGPDRAAAESGWWRLRAGAPTRSPPVYSCTSAVARAPRTATTSPSELQVADLDEIEHADPLERVDLDERAVDAPDASRRLRSSSPQVLDRRRRARRARAPRARAACSRRDGRRARR